MKKVTLNANDLFGQASKEVSSFDFHSIASALHGDLKRDLSRGLRRNTVGTDPEKRFFYDAQSIAFTKKAAPPGKMDSGQKAHDQCVFDFLRNIDRLSGFDPCLNTRAHYVSRDGTFTKADLRARHLALSKQIIAAVLGPAPELTEVLEGFSHSSGSSLGVPSERTNVEDKWRLPVTVTGDLGSDLVRLACRYQDIFHAVCDMNNATDVCVRRVPGSRFFVVPKNEDTGRGICIEATANMGFQLSIFASLVRRLCHPVYAPKSFAIDLSRQQNVHCYLAFLGSIIEHICTVDKKMASDCVLTDVVRHLWPHDWFYLLDSVRAKVVRVEGKKYTPPFFSTMGNATTFPIMTLTLYALALASVQVVCLSSQSSIPDWERLEHYSKQTSVFGDDCILPSAAANHFIMMAESLGFIVNKDKSHYEAGDRFRESCGADFLGGRNVRPYYMGGPVDTRISSLGPWLATIFNGCLKKYRTYFGNLNYVYGSDLMWKILCIARSHGIVFPVVPDSFPDDSGLKILSDPRILLAYPFAIYNPYVDRNMCGRFWYWSNTPDQSIGNHMLRYQLWKWKNRRSRPTQDFLHALNCVEAVCGTRTALRALALEYHKYFDTPAQATYIKEKFTGYTIKKSVYTGI